MKFLLDVNALVAWRHSRSPHHTRFHAWVAAHGFDQVATCALAELGFVRVSMQAFGYTLAEAQAALAEMKKQCPGFVETAPSPKLPSWASTAARTTDAYLAQISAANDLTLVTFDAGIPGATLV